MSDSAMTYDVRMRTPIGIRLGKITVNRKNDRISGFFNILNHSEPFSGTIDDDGNCCFMGKIVTLMRTVHYQAVGKILPDRIAVSIRDGHYILEIIGTPTEIRKGNCL